jgi:hypothetical protein
VVPDKSDRIAFLGNPLVIVALSSMDHNYDFFDDKVLDRAWLFVLAVVVLCIVLISARLAMVPL